MVFQNINPSKFADKLKESNISINGNITSKNLNEKSGLASEVYVDISTNDISKVAEIANSLSGVVITKEPTTSELLMQQIADLKLEILQLKAGN